MPSDLPGFIRYFAHTEDDTPLGRAALEYLRSMIRIAPVKLVMMHPAITGAWRSYENLLLTPMTGSYVNAVCCHPSRWVWHSSVPMTDGPTDDDGLPAAPQGNLDAPHRITEHAERTEELYTPRVRNVAFVACAPTTDDQARTLSRYEATIFPESARAAAFMTRWPIYAKCTPSFVVPVPVGNTGHRCIRDAIVGFGMSSMS